MKTLFTILFCFFSLSNVYATNYYLSETGNDTNSGTSSSNPWKTITRLNKATFASSDTVFFKAGNTFRGNIIVKQGEKSSSPVVFTFYGEGSKPIISGAEPVINWVLSGNIYQANSTIATVTNFFVNDKEQILARYPNDHNYLYLDSAGVRHLKDASLTSISSSLITEAKVCVHTAQWSWEKSSVLSYSGDKITYGSAMDINAIANYGYFLYDNLAHLDTATEWKHDTVNKKLNYIPSLGKNPNSLNCEASVYNNGILFRNNLNSFSY